jgi:hypothetical protein
MRDLEGCKLKPMAALELDSGLLMAEWALCDRVVEYLAQVAGQMHEDAARYSNFLSLIVNELVELAFKTSSGEGTVKFEVHKDVEDLRISVGYLCREDDCQNIVRLIGEASAEELRPRAASAITDDELRLVRLAKLFHVELSAHAAASGRIAIASSLKWRGEFH